MAAVSFHLSDQSKLAESWACEPPLTVGRQDRGEPEWGPFEGAGENRLIVAPITNREFPRRLFRVERDGDGLVLVNCNPRLDVELFGVCRLAPGQRHPLRGPVTVALSATLQLRVLPAQDDICGSEFDDCEPLRTLDHRPPDPASVTMASFYRTLPAERGPGADELLELLQLVLPVVRESVSSGSFYTAAALAALRIAGLNRALVVLLPGDKRIFRAEVYSDTLDDLESSQLRRSAPDVSDSMIKSVQSSGLTKIYEQGMSKAGLGQSVQNLHEVICAPVLDKDRRVIGVLYGDRWREVPASRSPDVEAQLVEILAGAISAGLARQHEEQQRSKMEQFFPGVVARHIADDPTLLDPKEADVTLMFCDVRKFSSISRQLGSTRTIEWMQDMFTTLGECVEEHHGVVINYVGDELIAMWGAPEPTADHAARSLRAARAMMDRMSLLEQRWGDELCEPLRVGIGINSGIAAVGNTGSKVEFQYGVFGNVVNVASRLQSATKQFGVDCLVSAATLHRAGDVFPVRELATIKVVGINEEIVIHELPHRPPEDWTDLRDRYQSALSDYAAARFADAVRKLGELLREFPQDEPSMRLLGLSVAELRQPSEPFSPVSSLTQK
ncbi:MAG: adenylate/guanylate cyclase domain-containing protein [Planctomycetales bacterium]|nr:adenylate/guanylate cyclase domain-containing protein [Planctomycetales bacterium]